MGDDAALCEHALDQLLDQHFIVDGRVVGRPVPDLDDVDRVAHALAPARDGKERRVGQAAYERVPIAHETIRGLHDALEVEAAAPEELPVVDPVRWRGDVDRRVGPRLVPRVREDMRVDEESRTVPALHESVQLQRLVGEGDRGHAHPELPRQPADGRKRPVQRVLPVDDADRELAANLFLEALRSLAVDHHHVLVHRVPPRCPRGASGAVTAHPARGFRPVRGPRGADGTLGPRVRHPERRRDGSPGGGPTGGSLPRIVGSCPAVSRRPYGRSGGSAYVQMGELSTYRMGLGARSATKGHPSLVRGRASQRPRVPVGGQSGIGVSPTLPGR